MALSKMLLPGGAAVLVGAIGWWWTTFGDVVAYGYLSWTEAGRCLVHDFGHLHAGPDALSRQPSQISSGLLD